MAKIAATYPHQVDPTTVRECVIEVFDVDEFGIYLQVEPVPMSICRIQIPWREIVELLPKKVERLLEVMKEQEEAD